MVIELRVQKRAFPPLPTRPRLVLAVYPALLRVAKLKTFFRSTNASGIGNLGENMILRRSVLIRAAADERFATYVHARVGKHVDAQMGKFAAILRYKTDGTDEVRPPYTC